MSYIRWIWRFWRPHKHWLVVLFFLTLLSSAVTIGYPLVFRYLIDGLQQALSARNPQLAASEPWHLLWMMAIIGLARSLANTYPGFRAMINAKLEMDIRRYYFGVILEKGYRFFNRFRTGDLVTRLTDDISNHPKIAWFSCSGIFRAVESTSKFIFCMTFMLTMNWNLALLAITPLPVMLWIYYRIRISMGSRAMARQRAVSRTNDALESAFSGVRILKAFNAEANQAQAFRGILNQRVDAELRMTRMWLGIQNLYWGIQFAGQIIVVLVGGYMVITDQLTYGQFYAFYQYMSLLLGPLMDLPNLFVTSRQAFASIDRENEIEDAPGGTEGIMLGRAPLERVEALELDGVTFTYDGATQPAVSGVKLALAAGQRAAVVGAVGSGKSTLLKIAAGILPPSTGEVRVNRRPLADFDLTALRRRCGYVPQEATLFSESVLENVNFGRQLPDDQLREALAMAQVLDEMEQLPDGLGQVLGQRGLTVSGGQKQRLAIARSLAGGPDVLFMDDCTASLDAENERRFWEQFSQRYPQAACLIVTHRMATARQADTIYVMSRGRLVGSGTHSELAAGCPEYRELLTRDEILAALSAPQRRSA
jgi:ATP-binding cassette, subfamily B, multidrug efflux pump